MATPRVLIHSALFDYALTQLGDAADMDERLGRELYRLSLYADLVAIVPGQDALRIYRTADFVREDGQLIRLWIYFVLRSDNAVELQNIEAVEEDMTGETPGIGGTPSWIKSPGTEETAAWDIKGKGAIPQRGKRSSIQVALRESGASERSFRMHGVCTTCSGTSENGPAKESGEAAATVMISPPTVVRLREP